MNIQKAKFRITFVEAVLGSTPGDKDVQAKFVASKAPTIEATEEELAANPVTPEEAAKQVAEAQEKSKTVFPKDEQGLFMWDYQFRGFLKAAVGVLIELGDITDLTKWAHKGAVDKYVFAGPRKIPFMTADGQRYKESPSDLQRPLMAETMQGPRVALANSEMIPAGTYIELEISCLTGAPKKKKDGTLVPSKAVLDLDTIRKCLDYGQFNGCGQWRSGGYGRFTWEEITTAKAA
jgi:hypothetical protein